MDTYFGDYLISDNKELLQTDRVYELLSTTYWANKRSKETMLKSIETSFCFGVYDDGALIGFARCVTDYAVMYWLCDVVINEKYRGQGIGLALVKTIIEHETFAPLRCILATMDAHGLYERFGFNRNEKFFMEKFPASL